MGNSLVTYGRDASGQLVAIQPASGAVLCLDTSWSMEMCDTGSEARRIDVLATVLCEVLQNVTLTACCTFSSGVTEIPLSGDINVPNPEGTTQMHLAIKWALDRRATRIVLVTDGEPDNRNLCMEYAAICRTRNVIIDAWYCGPRNSECEQWLRTLVATAAPGGKAGQFALTGPGADAAAAEIILRIGHSPS